MPSVARVPAPVFAALGDETRLGLMAHLCQVGPTSITRLTTGASVSRQAVAKHLRVLEDCGLARSRRQGRESVWELQPRRLQAARTYLDQMSASWDQALGRLKAFVER